MGADPEDVPKQRLRQDGGGVPGCHDAAILQHRDQVAEGGCEVEIVHRDDAGHPKAFDERQDLDLMLDVEMVCRFVQQKLARLLGKRAGDLGALALTTG